MNNYNPNIHHRRSIRLKGYDYSKEGLYFITICVKDRKCLFGEIVIVDDIAGAGFGVGVQNFEPRQNIEFQQHVRHNNDFLRKQMKLNDAGIIADKCWSEIPDHFPNAVLHEYIIMPDHVHGIIELIESVEVGVQNFEPRPRQQNIEFVRQNAFQKIIPHSIGSIVRGYKIGVTKWFRNNAMARGNILPATIWQRNYYEHIIRNERSYYRIREYILNNPAKWQIK